MVANIAGLAIREVEGVYRLAPFGAGQAVASLAFNLTNTAPADVGIQAEVGEKEVAIDARIIAVYGANLPEVYTQIRANVAAQIEHMTQLTVVEVNVDVVDLHFPSEEVVDA